MKHVKGVYFGYNTPEDVSAICLLHSHFYGSVASRAR